MSMTTTLVVEDVESGGKDPNDTIINDFAYQNNVLNATKAIRLAFIRKVYSLLTVQLILTVAIGATFMFVEPVKGYVQQNDWMWISSLFMTFVVIFALYFLRRNTPWNFILLITYTVCMAYSVGVVITLFDQWTVLLAFFLTGTIFVSLTLYTCQSKYDFSVLHGTLFTALFLLIFAGILEMFFYQYTFHVLISVFGAILMCCFIIYDTHLIMKKLSPEEYILATINLYCDIMNLFLYILRILQGSRN